MIATHKGCLKPEGKDCPICPLLERQGYGKVRAHLAGQPSAKVQQRNRFVREACIHRGPETRKATCKTCIGRVELKVFACSKRGECTVEKLADKERLECCRICKDYQAPVAAPATAKPKPRRSKTIKALGPPETIVPPPGVERTDHVVVTLNIGNVMGLAARASMMAAAHRWGATYAEIGRPIHQPAGRTEIDYKVCWQKVALAEWAASKGFTRVAYYDSDIVIRSDCPSVFEQVPLGSLGIVSNQQGDFIPKERAKQRRYDSDRRWWTARLGGKAPDAHGHINGGLIVFEPAAHRNLFASWRAAADSVDWGRADVLVDEAAFSVIVHNDPAPRVWLPPTWNLLFYRFPSLRSSTVMQGYAYHAAGKNKERLARLQWDLSKAAAFSWRDIKEEKMFDFQSTYDEMVVRFPDGAAFVELGCWRGKSSCYLAERIKASGKSIRLYCVDTWRGTQQSAKHHWMRKIVEAAGGDLFPTWRDNLSQAGVLEFATPIQEDSSRAARHFADNSLDFVFVDADHSYEGCMADIRAWLPKLKGGGVMAGHDYTPDTMPGVVRSVREVFGDRFRVVGRTWIVDSPHHNSPHSAEIQGISEQLSTVP